MTWIAFGYSCKLLNKIIRYHEHQERRKKVEGVEAEEHIIVKEYNGSLVIEFVQVFVPESK